MKKMMFLLLLASVVATGAAEIPFDSVSTLVVVPVTINDSRPFRAVLDTGMPEGAVLFDPADGEGIGLNVVGVAQVAGVGGDSVPANIATGASLSMGGHTLENQRVIVMAERSPLADFGVDAIVGASFFNRFVIDFDFDTGKLRLVEPDAYRPDQGAHALPMKLVGSKPVVEMTVGDTVVSMLVDTGARKFLTLVQSDESGWDRPDATVDAVIGTGVGGNLHGAIGRMPRVGLGRVEFRDVVTRFSDEAIEGHDGVLGMGLMRRLRIAFDYPGERIMVAPTKRVSDPFEFNMAGLVIYPHGGEGVRVEDVVADSPAAAAGIMAGDRIVAVDGKPVPDYAAGELAQMFEHNGRRITVTLQREQERRDVKLKLKRLI